MLEPHELEIEYGGYVRKSSESEERQVQSIPRQKDELMEVVQRDGLSLFGDIIEETQSAFSLGRPGFETLVRLTETGKINAWLCWHPSRLSRNAVDAGRVVHLMDSGLLHHIKTPSRTFYNTPTDKMMLQIELTMSKKDSDDKSEFVKSGLRKRYRKGLPTGKAPIGYRNDTSAEKGNRGWRVDSERFAQLKKLFKRFLKGRDSITSLTNYAREELKLTTVPSKRQGGLLVGRSLVEHILKNSVYAGFFYVKEAATHKRMELSPEVSRLISEEEHFRILNILGKRSHPKSQKHQPPYCGVLVGSDGNYIGADVKYQVICDCGKKFAYRTKTHCPACGIKITRMERPQYLHYTYYYNVKRKQSRQHSAKSIEEKQVEAVLKQFFSEDLQLCPSLYTWMKKHIGQLEDSEVEEKRAQRNRVQKEQAKIKKQKQKLRLLFTEGLISAEEFREDARTLEASLTSLSDSQTQEKHWSDFLSTVVDTVYSFEAILEKGTAKQKKELLRLLGSNLIWNEEKLFISKPKWLSAFIEGRKTVLAQYPVFEPKNQPKNKGRNTLLDTYCPTVLGWLDDVRKIWRKREPLL